jgi:hypothetical protein
MVVHGLCHKGCEMGQINKHSELLNGSVTVNHEVINAVVLCLLNLNFGINHCVHRVYWQSYIMHANIH